MATRTVRYNPIERQGPRPLRIFSWPQLVGMAVGAMILFGVGAQGSMGFVLLGTVGAVVGVFIKFGEYTPVEWLVPLARWARVKISRRRFYIQGAGLPGPLADSVVLPYETEEFGGQT